MIAGPHIDNLAQNSIELKQKKARQTDLGCTAHHLIGNIPYRNIIVDAARPSGFQEFGSGM